MSDSASTSSAQIAVITVAYRSNDVLPDFLESISAAVTEPVVVVVADNAASDRSSSTELTSGAYKASYLPMPENLGYGAAANAAVRSLPASVSWILVSNPDVRLQPGSLDELLAYSRSHSIVGSVGPRVLDATGQIYPSARAIPSLRVGIGHAILGDIWPGNPWSRRYHRDSEYGDSARTAGWLSGSCLLIRREAFEAVGGFDESFFMYFEDVDLGYRLGRAGWSSVYDPHATVVHTGAHSTSADSAHMVRVHHRSAFLFLSKKYPQWYLWPLRASLHLALRGRGSIQSRRRLRAAAAQGVAQSGETTSETEAR